MQEKEHEPDSILLVGDKKFKHQPMRMSAGLVLQPVDLEIIYFVHL